MDTSFGDGELDPLPRQRDTELTLSNMTLLGIFFGLVLVCGLFFGMGYAVGRHGSPDTAASVPAPAVSAAAATASISAAHPKPSANSQAASSPQAATDAPSAPESASDAGDQAADQPAVRAAALPSTNAGDAGASSTGARVQPAALPGAPIMVQVAAVSHQEDADVLIYALRKRGYTISVHHDLVDNLLHVRVGPFTNRADADAMRQKLLNDGYNAIVQP